MVKNRKINILIHILIWGIYLSLPVFILPQPSEFIKSSEINLLRYFVIGALTVAFFYFNYYFAIPKYFFKRKYFWYFSYIIAFLILSFIIIRLTIYFNYSSTNCIDPDSPGLNGYYFPRFFLIFIVSLSLRFNQRLKQIESEKIKSELSSLKAQLNPHFLFNILNDIYGQAITKSEHTADSIAKLSSMMRYVLTEAIAEKVALEKEIKYMKSYIDLQKIRLTEKTMVVFEIDGNANAKQIYPLLFISFIENAFKYGVSNETESEITIKFSIDNDSITLLVKNDKMSKGANPTDSSNIGIDNTKRRLDLIFGDNYSLDITDNETCFEVNLKIPAI